MPETVPRHPEHGRQSILNLPADLLGKPNAMSIIWAIGAEVEELEEAIWSVITMRLIDSAGIHQLRILGSIVGQPDLGFTEVGYRQAIRARALANRSQGRADDLLAVIKEFYSADFEIRSYEDQVAKLEIVADELDAPGDVTLEQALRIVRAAKAAGVYLRFLLTTGVGLKCASSTGGSFGQGTLQSSSGGFGPGFVYAIY